MLTATDLPRPVGFVLGGGGSLGASQVGMLQALTERGVFPDLVVGTSVGALNGAVVALDPLSAARRLGRIWPGNTRQMVFPGGLLAQVRTLQQGRTHVFPDTGLRAVLASYLGPDSSFADLALPFGAVTMDVATAAPHVITEGPLQPAVQASTAIPGGLSGGPPRRPPAVRRRGRGQRPGHPGTRHGRPVAGGTGRGVPGPAAEAAGVARRGAAVHGDGHHARPGDAGGADGGDPRARGLPAGPGDPPGVPPLEFDHTAMLLEGARQATGAFLESVEVHGPGLYGSPTGL